MAMKSATADIAEGEGLLPPVPSESAGNASGGSYPQEAVVGERGYPFSHYLGNHELQGDAAAASSSSSPLEVVAAAAMGGAAAAAVGLVMVARHRRDETVRVDMQPLLGEAAESLVARQEYSSIY